MSKQEITLSMVIPTLGRVDEVAELLDSIVNIKQEATCEIIIVDQNESPVLDDIINKYNSHLFIRHEKVSSKGVSRARNYGLKLASGSFVCFPDDDCKFRKNSVRKALTLLQNEKFDCVCGRSYDEVTGNDSMFSYPKNSKVLTIHNMDNSFVEYTAFFKREVALRYLYDEEMGPGCLHGAHEGYDVFYRMLTDGCQIYYTPEIVFNHPEKKCGTTSSHDLKRAFYYSCGFGYLCKKNSLSLKYHKRLYLLYASMPYFYLFHHASYKYYSVQIHGLKIGHDYI